jgi:ribonuclease E
MVKKENSESVESTGKPAAAKPSAKKPSAKKVVEAKPTEKMPAEKQPGDKKPAEKKPAATKKPAAKKTVAKEPAELAPAAEKKTGKKSAAKAEPQAAAAPVAVTATSMLFMAPDLPTPVIDKKRGRPVEDKKPTASGETTVRRRSRRREGEVAEGEQLPPNTVVKVRTPREPKEFSNEPTRIKGSTRLEAKKQRRRDGRDAGRRRTTITESEFLARREAVDRTMVVRSKDGKIQLGVLEDKVLVEHYVAKASEASLIGNVYLGKVQNVLPSMEAAFVDIGRGRNAVLYSGEVDWELAETGNKSRRIELALKSGDTVLVQVTKDPVGQKGARLTSQISLPGRYLVYVPNGSMNGISRKLPESERARLKKILKEVLPEDAGVIVRTASEGATEEQLTLDVQRLQQQWAEIEKKVKKGNAPVSTSTLSRKRSGQT